MQIFHRSGRHVRLVLIFFFLFSNLRPLAKPEPPRPTTFSNAGQQDDLCNTESDMIFFTLRDSRLPEIQQAELPDSMQVMLRDEHSALNWAIMPGFFVHGLGHLYAGDKKTFTKLLLIEVGCFVMAGVGVYWTLSGGMSEGNHEASRLESAGKTILYASLVIFIASWLYDVLASPRKVRAHNERLIEDYLKNR